MKKNEVLIHATYYRDEPQKHYANWKKPETKDCILYATIYMRSLEKVKS